MNKPTVHDIAREAGVSLATVDRVLNARPGVREKTVARVREAIASLGYVRDTYAANLARQRQYRFVFLLPEGPNQFVKTIRNALAEATSAQQIERVSAQVVTAPTYDPHEVARMLGSLTRRKPDGVAIMAPETPQVRDAVARLRSEGVPVIAVASDLPNSTRDHFVGINSYSAGRTAAVLMGRFLASATGEVLVATNSLQAHDSLERRRGFDDVMAAEFPKLRALPSIESHDDAARMADTVCTAVKTTPSILGVYSMGSGNAPLLEGLRMSGHIGDVVVIVHELTPVTRRALVDQEVDAVITQNVGHLVRSALRVLRAKSDGTAIFEAQERIRTDIVIKENLP